MGANAGPRPILGPLDQTRPHRIERDIADGGHQMIFVHGHRAEPSLPQMADPVMAGIYLSGVAPVQIAKDASKPVFIRRRDDHVDMVRHQAIGPHRYPGRDGRPRQKIAIEPVIRVTEKRRFAPVATLGDVVQNTRNNDPGDASHS